jgi:hypothetical protein
MLVRVTEANGDETVDDVSRDCFAHAPLFRRAWLGKTQYGWRHGRCSVAGRFEAQETYKHLGVQKGGAEMDVIGRQRVNGSGRGRLRGAIRVSDGSVGVVPCLLPVARCISRVHRGSGYSSCRLLIRDD